MKTDGEDITEHISKDSAMADLLSNQLTQKSIIAVMSQTIKSQGSVLNLISGIGA